MIKRCFWAVAVVPLFFFCVTLQANAVSFKFGEADISVGGSARYDVGYKFSDLGDVPAGQEDSLTDFFLENPGNSRVNLKVSYDKIMGFAELGLKGDAAGNGVSTRYLYAKYDMGSGNNLVIGQTDSILSIGKPNQRMMGDDILFGFGNLDLNRKVQIQFNHQAGPMLYQFAIEDNRTAVINGTVTGSHVTEQVTPALLTAITYSDKGIVLSPSAYFQTVKLKANDTTADDVTVNSWALALNGAFKIPAMTFSYEGWYGNNLSTLPGPPGGDMRPAKKSSNMLAPLADGNDIKDVKSMGGWFQFTVPVQPVEINVGAGMQKADVENSGAAYESSVQTMAVFANVKYVITNGFYMQPEIAWFDYGQDAQKTLSGAGYATGDNDLGSDLYAGIHFQYDF
ncbi:MAG: hypothetical protein ABFD70_12955 [Syntrophaceae bacterium]|nr:hypothetical protein [Deltaproteobacteria bacterium]